MSKYFQTISRLQKDLRDPSSSRPAESLDSDRNLEPATVEVEELSGPPFHELHPASPQATFSTVLDLLRASTEKSPTRSAVIASVSTRELLSPVISGLSAAAEEKGISLGVATLHTSRQGPTLNLSPRTVRSGFATGPGGTGSSPHRLSGGPIEETARRFLQDAVTGHDLLIVEAPPLLTSVDAALVGRASSGLVIVAEVLQTRRQDLQSAVRTAQRVDCHLIGVMLTATRRWLPGWMGRILDGLGLSLDSATNSRRS